MRRGRVLVCGVILWGLALSGGGIARAAGSQPEQGPPAPERNWQIGVTPTYSSGDYGTNSTSSFFSAPWTFRRLFKDGDISLIIPFVVSSTDGGVTLVDGKPVKVDKKVEDGGVQSVDCDKKGNGKSCLTGRAAGQTVTTAGIGDVLLRGRYYLMEETEVRPLVALTARMKFPTANASQGLGTGAFDHGYGVEVSKVFFEKFITYLDGGYNFIGDPDGLELRNQYWYDVGAGYYVTKRFLISVYYDEYRALVPDFVNSRDVFFAFNYKASDAWRFNAGFTKGLSDNAPDYAVSIGTSYRF
ncbi:MAG: transporter [Nitrospira sp.]|nr:transporter [Nitrospira sp.]